MRHERYFPLICEFASTNEVILFAEFMAFSLCRRVVRARCAEEVHFAEQGPGVQPAQDGLLARG
jgi:hypothetical protein